MQQKREVGFPLPRTDNRRSVEQGWEKPTYQHPQAEAGQASNYKRCQVKDSKSDPYTNGQYSSINARTKMGETKNSEMNQIAQGIWQYLINKSITITAEYLPTSQNVRADWESRHVQDSSKWKLNPRFFIYICRKLDQPSVNHFVSQLTWQIEPYILSKVNPCCKAVEFLRQKWTHKIPYGFPPFCLKERVVRKVEQDRAKILVIIPTWQS